MSKLWSNRDNDVDSSLPASDEYAEQTKRSSSNGIYFHEKVIRSPMTNVNLGTCFDDVLVKWIRKYLPIIFEDAMF